MAIRLGSTVINCADLDVMTAFWSRALHLSPSSAEPGDEFRVLRGEHASLSLQRSRTPVSARDQMHLDLYTDDLVAEVAGSPGSAPRLSAATVSPATITSSWPTRRATSSASAPNRTCDHAVAVHRAR